MFRLEDTCFYYDCKNRALLKGIVKSITFSTRINDEGAELTDVVYYIHCGDSHIVDIADYLLFKSKEQFLGEVL